MTADVVICGAGIAGVAGAYHLAVWRGRSRIVLVDERAPLSLTSDKSTECYRNWWPGPGDAMVALMNRSIDLLEEQARESGNVFRLNRRGYLFATAEPDRIAMFRQAAEDAAALGAGPLRVHARATSDYRPAAAEGFEEPLTGADLLLDPELIRRQFPCLAPDTVALLHARRCGWLSGQQLGMYLLERAREKGVRVLTGRVDAVDTTGGRIRAVRVQTPGGTETLATEHFVDAAGPFLPHVGRRLGIDLPVFSERHAKIAFNDTLGAVPREAPLLIWTDPLHLAWTDEERADLEGSEKHRRLLEEFPAGVHARPEGGGESRMVLVIWTYDAEAVEPTFPITVDAAYAEICLRGMTRMIPGLGAYLGRLPRAVVDGGYYTKTRENRLLAGPLPVQGAWVLGALSGYGLMAANGAADLLAAHITGGPLPPYAPAFALDRYEDPGYRALLERWGDSGQL